MIIMHVLFNLQQEITVSIAVQNISLPLSHPHKIRRNGEIVPDEPFVKPHVKVSEKQKTVMSELRG